MDDDTKNLLIRVEALARQVRFQADALDLVVEFARYQDQVNNPPPRSNEFCTCARCRHAVA